MGSKKILLGQKYENVHTCNALSRKIAPFLNIFLPVKIFVDLSCFFDFDQGRHSCPRGLLCSYTSGINFMRVWTDLCNRKCSYAAGNNFVRVWTDLCDRKCSHAAGNNFMQVWTDLCDRKCSHAAASDFVQVWTDRWDRKRSHAAGIDFMRTWTDLYERKWSCAAGTKFMQLTVGRNSILNFPAKIWTGMCRALLCGDDSSHSQGQSGKRLLLASRGHPIRSAAYQGSCIDPSYLSHTLDPTLGTPGA